MHYKFFYTNQCPRCPEVKKRLEERNDLEGEWIAADTKEGLDEARKYNVIQAPTVIFFEKENEIHRAGSVAEIEKI